MRCSSNANQRFLSTCKPPCRMSGLRDPTRGLHYDFNRVSRPLASIHPLLSVVFVLPNRCSLNFETIPQTYSGLPSHYGALRPRAHVTWTTRLRALGELCVVHTPTAERRHNPG